MKVRSYSDLVDVQRDFKKLRESVEATLRRSSRSNWSLEIASLQVRTKSDQKLINHSRFTTMFNEIRDLQSYLSVVANMITALRHHIGSDSKGRDRTLANAVKLEAEIKKGLNSAFSNTTKIATTILPKDFKQLVKASFKYLNKDLSKISGKQTCHMMFYPSAGSISYAGYMCFKDLKDSNNYTYRTQYVVISCTVKAGKPTYSLATTCKRLLPFEITGKVIELENLSKEFDLITSRFK